MQLCKYETFCYLYIRFKQNGIDMTTSNQSFWNSPDGINNYPIKLQSLLVKCDFCDEAHEDDIVQKVDGYFLCDVCVEVYNDQKAYTEYL